MFIALFVAVFAATMPVKQDFDTLAASSISLEDIEKLSTTLKEMPSAQEMSQKISEMEGLLSVYESKNVIPLPTQKGVEELMDEIETLTFNAPPAVEMPLMLTTPSYTDGALNIFILDGKAYVADFTAQSAYQGLKRYNAKSYIQDDVRVSFELRNPTKWKELPQHMYHWFADFEVAKPEGTPISDLPRIIQESKGQMSGARLPIYIIQTDTASLELYLEHKKQLMDLDISVHSMGLAFTQYGKLGSRNLLNDRTRKARAEMRRTGVKPPPIIWRPE
jgi:hypothetical protein